MTTRQDLLAQWQHQLQLAEAADREGPSWRMRIRQRLYRFLLAMYGGATWTGSPDDATEVTTHPKQLLVSDDVDLPESTNEATLLDHGKAPRNRAEILRGLKNIRGLSEELAPRGPLQDGLPPDAPVAVATCKREPRASMLMAHLRAAGLSPTVVRRAELYQIFVSACDASLAGELLTRLEQQESAQRARRSIPRVPIRTSPALSAALIAGIVGIPLSFYVLCLWQLGQEVWLRHFPEPEQFAAVTVAAVVLDFLVAFLVWLSWREDQRSSQRGDSRPG